MKKQVGLGEGFGLGGNLVSAAELEAMVKRGLFHGHFWGETRHSAHRSGSLEPLGFDPLSHVSPLWLLSSWRRRRPRQLAPPPAAQTSHASVLARWGRTSVGRCKRGDQHAGAADCPRWRQLGQLIGLLSLLLIGGLAERPSPRRSSASPRLSRLCTVMGLTFSRAAVRL